MRVIIAAFNPASVRAADIGIGVVADHDESLCRDARRRHRPTEKGGGGLLAAKVRGEKDTIKAVGQSQQPQLRDREAALRV